MTRTRCTGPQGQHGKVQTGTRGRTKSSCGQEERSEKQNHAKPTLRPIQNQLKPRVVKPEFSVALYRNPAENPLNETIKGGL